MARRTISWSTALRDIKDDRAARQPVREERLRTASSFGAPMSAWRGQSGRCYVVGVHKATVAAMDDLNAQDCIAFVARDAQGVARIIGCEPGVSPFSGRRFETLRSAQCAGATELHVYRLCDTDAERRAFAADLIARIEEAA